MSETRVTKIYHSFANISSGPKASKKCMISNCFMNLEMIPGFGTIIDS